MNDELRELLRVRAGGRCEYCQLPEEWSNIPFEIDHIIAPKRSGSSAEANLAWSCYYCNSTKEINIALCEQAKQLGVAWTGYDSGVIIRLFHPRQDRWEEHFAWDGPVLRGLTPVGRATVEFLDINRNESAALRETLIAAGLFPSKP